MRGMVDHIFALSRRQMPPAAEDEAMSNIIPLSRSRVPAAALDPAERRRRLADELVAALRRHRRQALLLTALRWLYLLVVYGLVATAVDFAFVSYVAAAFWLVAVIGAALFVEPFCDIGGRAALHEHADAQAALARIEDGADPIDELVVSAKLLQLAAQAFVLESEE